MRQPRVRVQWADHRRGRQLSLVFALFTLEPVGVHMVYRGEADTTTALLGMCNFKHDNDRRTFAWQHQLPPWQERERAATLVW